VFETGTIPFRDMQPQSDSPFFVYVIESNPPEEHRFCEGKSLATALEFSGTPCRYLNAQNKVELDFFLRLGAPFQLAQQRKIPILHFSAHGSEHGIALTSTEFITWNELAPMLEPLQKVTQGHYLIAMSSCHGLAAVKIPLFTDIKMYGIVGTFRVVDWSDNVVAFTSFYHLLRKTNSITQAVEGMKSASANPHYQYISRPSYPQSCPPHVFRRPWMTGT
jgi:hypothetical protein